MGGVRVYDDYAHHPTEVTAQLKAARAVAGSGRLVVAFQPHLYSRTQEFAEGFGAALGLADEVVVMDVYGAREDPVPGVTGALVADAVPLPAGPGALRAVVVGGRPGAGRAGPARATWCSPWAPVTCRWSGPRCWRRCGPPEAAEEPARAGPAGEPDRHRRRGTAPGGRGGRPSAVRRGGDPARPRRRGRARRRRRAGAAGRRRSPALGGRRLAAAGQPAARREHGAGGRRRLAARRPGAGDRRHRRPGRRCCGSTSTPPGPGSPGCPRSPRSR